MNYYCFDDDDDHRRVVRVPDNGENQDKELDNLEVSPMTTKITAPTTPQVPPITPPTHPKPPLQPLPLNKKEVLVVAIGTSRRGKGLELVERTKERARRCLLQDGCRYCDILTSGAGGGNHDTDFVDEQDEMQIVTVSLWDDVALFRNYLLFQAQPQAEYQTVCHDLKLAHDTKFSIDQYQRLRNPFMSCAMTNAAVSNEHEINCQRNRPPPLTSAGNGPHKNGTFGIFIELSSPAAGEKRKLLQQYIYTSETCTRYEPGCIRYDVFEPWQEENQMDEEDIEPTGNEIDDNGSDSDSDTNEKSTRRCHRYLVHALFLDKDHYFNHKRNQGYSLVNRYTVHTFKQIGLPLPVVTTFHKEF